MEADSQFCLWGHDFCWVCRGMLWGVLRQGIAHENELSCRTVVAFACARMLRLFDLVVSCRHAFDVNDEFLDWGWMIWVITICDRCESCGCTRSMIHSSW